MTQNPFFRGVVKALKHTNVKFLSQDIIWSSIFTLNAVEWIEKHACRNLGHIYYKNKALADRICRKIMCS